MRAGVATAVVALLCGGAVAGPADLEEAELRRDLEYLASDALQGRRAGSPGATRAAAYVAARLRDAGVAPLRRGDYYQPFSFAATVRTSTGSSVVMDGARRPELEMGVDVEPLSFSSDGAVTAPVAFAGYGITAPEHGYDDYRGWDAKGYVVVAVAGEPQADDPAGSWNGAVATLHSDIWVKAENARAHGALALMLVAADGESDQRLRALGRMLARPAAGIPVLALARAAAEDLLSSRGESLLDRQRAIDVDLCSRSGPLPGGAVRIALKLKRHAAHTSNVLAAVGGDGGDGQALVVGAHYDHIGHPRGGAGQDRVYNGADDNASGTAVVLALARRLARHPPARRVILAFFGAEEKGLLGSLHYLQEPPFPLERTVAMINLDMVGRMRGERLLVGATGTSPQWPALVSAATAGLGLDLQTTVDGWGPSDHAFFFRHGVPVLFLFTGSHDDYHQPSDELARLNVAGTLRVLEVVSRLADRIAGAKVEIAFQCPVGPSRDADALELMGLLPGWSPAVARATEP